ncbi:Putative L,D-transpeptidase YkuD [Caulifigura coniformis]|uniref:L,D-transpeptidase YkuD n=1 Tax=Caulifigura coniformis TaxID=2527983 RepID=A0A517S9Z4_9PLAN|nr:L,D-transpeptidase family protein [Caulifigura coniformis]QDT52949.1 Putative L,D-transpeptidase YkuD [Caulifigura coniformis]
MRRTTHRTLLQSFRFWFVLLSVFALAAAWKLDLFGNRHRAEKKVASETLPDVDEDLESVEMLSDVSKGVTSSAPEPIDLGDVSPAPLPPREAARPRNSAPLAKMPAVTPRPAEPRNPFGPANPEFVAMDESQAGPVERAVVEETRDLRASGGARPFERTELRRTASLEPSPPDLTTPRPLSSEIAARREPAATFTTDNRVQRASNSQGDDRVPGVERATASSPPKPKFELPADSKVDLASIQKLIGDGDDIEAHRLMSEWYWKEPQSRPAFMDVLEQSARKIYLQAHPHYMDPHVVQQGQMLSTIAKEYGVPWQYLARLNRTDARRIKPGQKLKVIKGPFSAVVDLSDFELTIHAHGYFVKRYQVGIGKDNSSPYGNFKVQNKLTDPTYYGPTKIIEHDDPENPLGEYWISIGDSFGIHGTIHPDSIGKAESEGCIRLRDEDIAEVYDFLSEGSDVTIRP